MSLGRKLDKSNIPNFLSLLHISDLSISAEFVVICINKVKKVINPSEEIMEKIKIKNL